MLKRRRRAVALDPLSVFVRAVAVMGYPVNGIPGADSAAALAAHDEALAMDPNAVIHLWMSGVRNLLRILVGTPTRFSCSSVRSS